MSKRIIFGGLLAIGLTLTMGGAAQAQHYGHGRGNFGHGYGQGHYNYHQGHYRSGPVYVAPVYNRQVYSGLNSPYFGFGSSNFGGFNNGFNRGFNSGFNNFNRGFNTPFYGNPGFGRPGLSIGFNFFR